MKYACQFKKKFTFLADIKFFLIFFCLRGIVNIFIHANLNLKHKTEVDRKRNNRTFRCLRDKKSIKARESWDFYKLYELECFVQRIYQLGRERSLYSLYQRWRLRYFGANSGLCYFLAS